MENDNKLKNKSGARIAIGILVPLFIIGGILLLYFYGSPFFCLLYHFTGLYCFGCGAGRALHDLVHFHFLDALGHNFLFVLLLPFLIYFIASKYLNFVFNKKILKPMNIGFKTGVTVTVVIITYIVLRNIPVYPLTLLAP